MSRQGVCITEQSAGVTEAIDRFLAMSLRCAMAARPAPPWPSDQPQTAAFEDKMRDRIGFHGIALALLRDPARLANWPASLREHLLEQARAQTFWEMGHRTVLARLIALLDDAGTPALVTKGSALAYSAYPDPALRRRGDSDLLLGEVPRKPLRAVLAAHGFRPSGDPRPLQESWASQCPMGFTHVFDLHWRINSSALLAERLDRAGIGTRSAPLPRLSETARGIAPADNLVLIAINRALHETFGYQSGEAKLFEQDRLIWALDTHLLGSAFSAADWQDLLAAASASGTGPLVHSLLAYARATMETALPPEIVAALAILPEDPELLGYFEAMSGFARLRCDLAASPTLGAKLRLAGYTLFPGTEVLHERFPDAAHWPLAALQARRIVAGAGKLLRRGG